MLKSDEIKWRHVGMKLRSRLKQAGFLNGCGPKAGWAGKLVPNRILRLDVEEFCDWHDFNYLVGGKEADRVKADWQFYEAIHDRARELTAHWWGLVGRPLYFLTAWAYYRAVRLGGAPHFRYGERLTEAALMDLLMRAEERT